MNWLERRLFPQSRLLNFIVIVCLSAAFSYLLTGKQIALANWGMIDDHEMFTFLGPNLHLAPGDIWNTLLTKTEVGTLQGRFRPSYYLLKVIEAAAFGPNVHLWYLVNTVSFAIFLASIWWTTLRFAGIWLSGALTASIALLSLWADVWSRLGPSESFGAAAVGIGLFAADLVMFSARPLLRNVGAVILALAAITLAGLKETFIPLAAGGPALVFILAVMNRKLSLAVIAVLSCAILASYRRHRLRGIERTACRRRRLLRQVRRARGDADVCGPWWARRAVAHGVAVGASAAVFVDAENRAGKTAHGVGFGLCGWRSSSICF